MQHEHVGPINITGLRHARRRDQVMANGCSFGFGHPEQLIATSLFRIRH